MICAYEKFLDQSFLNQALVTINKIYTYDIYEDPIYGKLLAPGDTWHDYFNPGYFLPAAIKTFEIYDTNSAHDWKTIYDNNLTLLQNNQTKFDCYGLPSNWCKNDGTPIEGKSDLTFGYDACRVIDNIANGYNIYHDENLFTYLSAISTNSALLTRINSNDPISACSLKINPSTWGSENNSLGLVCILPAYQITGELSESKLESLLDDCLAVSATECLDYYKQAYKSVVLSVMTSDCSRYVTNLASLANPGYLIKIYPPNESSGSNPIMIKIPDNNEIYDLKSLFSYTTNTLNGEYLSATVLNNLSGNWNSVYNNVNSNSANWNEISGKLNEYTTFSSTINNEINSLSAIIDKKYYTSSFANISASLITEVSAGNDYVNVEKSSTSNGQSIYNINVILPSASFGIFNTSAIALTNVYDWNTIDLSWSAGTISALNQLSKNALYHIDLNLSINRDISALSDDYTTLIMKDKDDNQTYNIGLLDGSISADQYFNTSYLVYSTSALNYAFKIDLSGWNMNITRLDIIKEN